MKAPIEILRFTDRAGFRAWLAAHHQTDRECWVIVKKGRPTEARCLYYLDAIEEALCFGWIDSVNRSYEGELLQRFSPRRKRGAWSELNIARCRRLEALGLMTDAGRAGMPRTSTGDVFVVDEAIERAFSRHPEAKKNFHRMPLLYQRVRINTIQREGHKDEERFQKRLNRLIENSARNQLFGDWNDYGRLIDF